MGQKTDARIFRQGIIKKNWEVKYIEKNEEESSFYLFKTLEIQKYLNRFFKIYKMEIQDIKIFYSNDSLQVFVSFYITKKTVYMITRRLTPMPLPFRKNVFKRKKKRRKLKLRYIERQHKSLVKLSHLNYWYWTKKQFKYANNNKQVLRTLLDKTKIRKNLYFNKLKSNKINGLKKFQEILTDGLLKYTKNKVNIYVTLQNLNYSKQLSNTQIKGLKIIFKQLKRFVRNSFFKEAVNIFFISISKRKSAKLLATFISTQFKLNQLRVNQVSIARKDNYFMGFIKQTITLLLKSDVSCLTGVKIVVKGRFNKAPRARTRHIQCGKFSLQSINSKVSYFQSTAYTVNGTFGVKVWLSENILLHKLCIQDQTKRNIRKYKKVNY